jgi:hypothetical protein
VRSRQGGTEQRQGVGVEPDRLEPTLASCAVEDAKHQRFPEERGKH